MLDVGPMFETAADFLNRLRGHPTIKRGILRNTGERIGKDIRYILQQPDGKVVLDFWAPGWKAASEYIQELNKKGPIRYIVDGTETITCPPGWQPTTDKPDCGCGKCGPG